MSKVKLIEGNIPTQIIKLTLPMILGLMGMVVFNLVDAYFIGKLGVSELAAVSFTFPVVLFVGSISLGLGVAVSTILSKIVGSGDSSLAKRFTTDSLILAIIIAVAVVIIGLVTIEPLFTLLGATSEVLPFIKEYMVVWYIGVIFVVIPQVGNNAIRAEGDTLSPGLIMTASAIVNIILDPLLIFGLWGFPELGVAGGALATVISRMVGLVIALIILKYKYNLIGFAKMSWSSLIDNWKKLLYIGVPTAATRMIMPLGAFIITAILASFGKEVVAGYGIASKIEGLAVLVTMAIGSVISPFAGQNFGAGRFDRVLEATKVSIVLCALVSAVTFFILFFCGEFFAGFFVDNNEVVINTAGRYLKIVPFGYAFLSMLTVSSAILNVLNKPIMAGLFSVMQMFVLYIPLAYILKKVLGVNGVFVAMTISYIIAGISSYIYMRKKLSTKDSSGAIAV